jgi:hypothetical protein
MNLGETCLHLPPPPPQRVTRHDIDLHSTNSVKGYAAANERFLTAACVTHGIFSASFSTFQKVECN